MYKHTKSNSILSGAVTVYFSILCVLVKILSQNKEKGNEVFGIPFLSVVLKCHHGNERFKVGSDGIHLNVSFIAKDKATRQCL